MKFERLGNIIDIRKGKKPSFVDAPNKNSVRVLQIDDLRNDDNLKFTNDKTGVLANESDVLIAWDGANAGTIGYGKSGFIGSTIALLRKKRPELYSTSFLGVFLKSQYNYLRDKTTGATIPHISRKALEELEIPLIDIGQQNHIANLLNKIENMISHRKEGIGLLGEFLKSTFSEMFGDSVKNEQGFEVSIIKQLCDVKGGKRIPKGSKLIKENTGYPYIKAGNIKNGLITLKDIEYLTPELRKQLSRYTVEVGDVCVTVVGINIGDVGIVPPELHLANLTENSNKLLIKDKSVLNHIFLAYYLMSESVQSDFFNSIKATGVPKLALYKIENTKLLLPPIQLQTKFSRIVEKTEALKTQYQQSLQELENLYGSLSQRAFKGELAVKQLA